MTTLQKIIKYLALAFAIFLIINIISAILFGIGTLASVLGLKKSNNKTEYLEEVTSNIQMTDVATLKIDINYSNLKIKTGKFLSAESNDKNISCTQNKNQLVIKEDGHKWFSFNDASDLVVYIPENIEFEAVKIKTGAGEVYIENLNTNELSFDMGAGKVEIDKLIVSNEAKINGGVGKVDIKSSEIHNLNLDIGVGEFILNSKLTGNSDIDSGIGAMKIDLTDDISNYTIKASKGIGSITLGGEEIKTDKIYGDGDSYIKINGGIGAIEIK